MELEERSRLKIPGELVTREEGFMAGNGTFTGPGGGIHSALLGEVHFTSKLITVTHVKAAYAPQVGDVVVGRITEITGKRWRVDLGRLVASLNLHSIHLKEQRKKNEED
jgi:exosome complex component RRP4